MKGVERNSPMEIDIGVIADGSDRDEVEREDNVGSQPGSKKNRTEISSRGSGWRPGQGSINKKVVENGLSASNDSSENDYLSGNYDDDASGGGDGSGEVDGDDDGGSGDYDWDSGSGTMDVGESRWADIPVELLLRIMSHLDHRSVLIASWVCVGWKDSLCAGVVELSFGWCKGDVGSLVRSVAPKFRNVEGFDMRRCASVNDYSIEAVAANCHAIRVLDLSGTKLSDVSLFAIANGCRSLAHLDISGRLHIRDEGIIALASSCRGLISLNLCGCDRGVTDRSLKAIGQHCRNLQSLNLAWCERITDTGAQALADGCPDLQHLDLCGCSHITDLTITALAEKCLRLRALGLHCCRNITDVSMYALVSSQAARMQLGRAAGRTRQRSGYARFGLTHSEIFGDGVESPRRVCVSPTSAAERGVDGGGGGSDAEHATGSPRGAGGSPSSASSGMAPPYVHGASLLTSGSWRLGSNYHLSPVLQHSASCGGVGYAREAMAYDADSEAEAYGLASLNLSGCTSLHAYAVQQLCDSFPALHTCPEKRSLNVSGCLSLISVHCRCVSDVRRSRRRGVLGGNTMMLARPLPVNRPL